MELRQNWNRFSKLLGPIKPKKSSALLLHSNSRVVGGTISSSLSSTVGSCFKGEVGNSSQLSEMAEVVGSTNDVSSVTFVDREELLGLLSQIASVRSSAPSTDHYQAQIAKIRSILSGEKRVERSNLVQLFGDRSLDSFWPKNHFMLSLFKPFLGDLFPERKMLLICVVTGISRMESVLLDFDGSQLKGFCEPDFSSIEVEAGDYFHPNTAKRLVGFCENYYMLPTYAVVVTKRIWDQCREIQIKEDVKKAWRFLVSTKNMRDVETEVFIEPDPWPMKALLRWHCLKNFNKK